MSSIGACQNLRRGLVICCFMIILVAGCSNKIAGSWETVQIKPAGASFPFNRIQFDGGKYTAVGLYDGSGRMADEVQSTAGDYQQTGSKIKIQPYKGEEQSYTVRRRLDGKLEIVFRGAGGKPLKAVLAQSQ